MSVPYSWPATGITELLYTAFAKIGHRRMLAYNYDQCGAVLINRKTALTAAHCIKQSFQVYDRYYNGFFTVNVTLNNFHPNLESIYSMYFGTNFFIYYNVDLPHVQMGDIHDIYIVKILNLENSFNKIKFSIQILIIRHIKMTLRW